MMLLNITLFGVFGVMQCVYTVQKTHSFLYDYCTLLLLLYAPPFILRNEVCSVWPAIRCVVIGRMPQVPVTEMLRPFPCCGAMSRRNETKTIKPTINEAFFAFSEDIITDYNDSYGLFTRCAA